MTTARFLTGKVMIWSLCILTQVLVFGQQTAMPDTILTLPEVVVSGYLSRQPVLLTPASIGIVDAGQLRNLASESMLPAFNLIPGVRMEERSPGSYRLSIRGSLLRSPFGLRNVKVYVDEFPLTDAGGNTYINLIDANAIERIEVLKGPDGSLFGANSGGVVLLDLYGRRTDSSAVQLGWHTGSFGLFHETVSGAWVSDNSRFSFIQAYQRADNFREQSALRRHYFQASESLSYGKGHRLKLLVFHSDLHYETPGGLTLAQFDADPQQARPAAGPNPGAVEQQAGIYNQTWFAGVTNEWQISDQFRCVVSVSGTDTEFENPFITNYEIRKENNLGIRTFAEYENRIHSPIYWKGSLGLEAQRGWQDNSNFQNNGGIAGMASARDEVDICQVFYFSRWRATFYQRLTAELALSLNIHQFGYSGWTAAGSRDFTGQWMPRFAMSYLITHGFALRATVSRGYSPPTLAEIRSSNQVINTTLQPETGWNREMGLRVTPGKGRLQADASVFRYLLTNAIVRRLDAGGVEYFTNAGGTRQTGVEAAISAWLIPHKNTGWINALQITGAFTFNQFFFSSYQDATEDYSGNRLTGVPQTVMVWGMTLQFAGDIRWFTTFNYISALPLNDANTVYADGYGVLQSKISWSLQPGKKSGLSLFAGADNILNEKYSLGNDINAFGGRYFNAAPPLNFYGGLMIHFR